jgi:hypothetical protein
VPTPPPEVPDFLQGAEIRPLPIERDAGLTNMANLIIELGCTQCDGPTTGIGRAYAQRFKALRFDVLLTPEMLPLPEAGPEDQRYIAGFGFAPDGSDLMASVCVHGYCGGMGGPSADAEVWLFRSEDGGVTWTEYQRLPRPELVVGWLGPGVVLTSYYDDTTGVQSFTVRPTGEEVVPPRGHADAWPAVTAGGRLLWHAGDGLLLFPDGTVYAGTDQPEVSFGEPLLGPKTDLLPFFWKDRYYLAQLEPDGSVRRAFVADPWVQPEAWMTSLSDDRIFASASVPVDRYSMSGQFVGSLPHHRPGKRCRPAHLAAVPRASFLNGRNHVVAVQQGPLARVVNTGDCLSVRDAPSTDAGILVCLADNVLVRDLAETTTPDGLSWARVVTPQGPKAGPPPSTWSGSVRYLLLSSPPRSFSLPAATKDLAGRPADFPQHDRLAGSQQHNLAA